MARRGRDEFNRWLQSLGGSEKLDLRDADLSGADLSGCKFSHADMRGANLEGTILAGTDFQLANLEGAIFCGATADAPPDGGPYFMRADLRSAVFDGAALKHADFAEAYLEAANFQNAHLVSCSFRKANLQRADFTKALLFDCHFTESQLSSAKLCEAHFSRTHLERAVLSEANVASADFFESHLDGSNWSNVRGAESASNLQSTRIEGDTEYFDRVSLGRVERWCDWERLRTFGKMPLFGLSYSVLVLIPLYIYLIAWYNHQVDRFIDWRGPGEEWIGQHLHHLPLPSLSMLLLISTVLLAIASTIYTVFCPSRIKEFTRDVWCDQLGRPLIHYWPFAWKHQKLRMVCGVCYVLGAAGILYVLAVKVGKAAVYIWEHT
jgi:uncharacterized protein YjbI with pentapeptide repeats